MFRVGLTGGIGSGKSTVTKLFAEHGTPIIDTDLIAHQIVMPEGPAYQSVIEAFGHEILLSDFTINRKKLASVIFNSKEKKQKLESILHPLIWLITEQQINACDYPYCIIAVPLLFEGSHQARFNKTLVIDCTEEEQIERIVIRDNRSHDEIIAILKNQISRTERLNLADDIIINSGSLNNLKSEVDKLHQKYIKLSGL